MNVTVPQAQAIGIELPDPDLSQDPETGDWRFGPIDWDEFWRVVRGDGPCNAERLSARRGAHDDGRWVREAASALLVDDAAMCKYKRLGRGDRAVSPRCGRELGRTQRAVNVARKC